jgi:hypothetical protein
MDKQFRAKLRKSGKKGGWTYVIMPGSAKFFGTRGLVKVQGTMDGVAFAGSFMARGDGTHMLPVKLELRKKLGKDAGDTVRVHVKRRVTR